MPFGTDPLDIYHNNVWYSHTGAQISGIDDNNIVSATAVMVNGDTIFTSTGDVTVHDLVSVCVTANNATASTLQYRIVPTVGTSTTISGATTTLASVAAGTIVTLVGDALATAPTISPNGVGLSQAAKGIYFPAGTLKVVIGVGSTTGTWKHYLRYTPLQAGATVS